MTKLTFRLNCSLTGKFKKMKSANINSPTTQINSKERVDLDHFVQSGEGDCGGKNRTESLLRHPPVFRITFHCKATLYYHLGAWNKLKQMISRITRFVSWTASLYQSSFQTQYEGTNSMQLWTHHADYIINKTNKRLYSLRVLKQRGDRILHVYSFAQN